MLREYGFEWNNVNCEEYGIVLENKEIPLIPERRVIKKKIPGIDGTINYDTGTSENITIKAKCYFWDRTIERLQQNKYKIKHWLNTGTGVLSFNDDADKFYIGAIKNQIPLEDLFTLGRFTLIWECEPFAYSKHVSDKKVRFDSPWALGGGYKFNIIPTVWSSSGEKEVYNWGLDKVKPVIKVIGSCNRISFTCNGVKISYNASLTNQTLLIDCKNKTARIGSRNVLKHISTTPNEWDTIELIPGNNHFSISGTSLNCEVSLVFRGKY